MLTDTALIVLGIIANKPSNPYDINKTINYRRKELKRTVPAQTIYAIINMLNNKKFISGKRVKNGNFHDKTIYKITKQGERLLRDNLISFLSTLEDFRSNFIVAILLSGYLNQETILKSCREYQKILKAEIALREKITKAEKEQEVSAAGQIVLQHILKSLKVNLKTVDEFIKLIESGTQLDGLPIPFWRG
jgi:DNA-binding PadR family transcriptional regulator